MEPRDAASIVVYDHRTGAVKVLMGQRLSTTTFMPGRYVFPGGRLDATDVAVAAGSPSLAAPVVDQLMLDMRGAPSAARARALGITAVRETFEEAGVIFGVEPAPSTASPLRDPTDLPTAEAWQAAPWPQLRAVGFEPDPSPLKLFARAITPPGEIRRYDTRFFCVPRELAIAETANQDGELVNLGWYGLDEVEGLSVAGITKIILRDFHTQLTSGLLGGPTTPVPLYHFVDGAFCRELLLSKKQN